jgi:polysaccharide biosynthesis/export protein
MRYCLSKTVLGFLGVLLVGCLLGACAQPQAGPGPSRAAQDNEAPENYLLGSEDVIDVQVWKNADLSKVVTVRPDGKISLPLLGDIQAGGLTPQQLSESIIEKLKEYYKEPPQVSVIVQQINSYAIFVLGEVRTPGRFVVKSGTTLVQAIAQAGGFSQFASVNRIRILRRGADNKEVILLARYKDIIAGQQSNILLKPNDSVVVP